MNARAHVMVEHGGRLVCLRELARVTGLAYFCLWERHRKGLRGAELLAPARRAHNRKPATGET